MMVVNTVFVDFEGFVGGPNMHVELRAVFVDDAREDATDDGCADDFRDSVPEAGHVAPRGDGSSCCGSSGDVENPFGELRSWTIGPPNVSVNFPRLFRLW